MTRVETRYLSITELFLSPKRNWTAEFSVPMQAEYKIEVH